MAIIAKQAYFISPPIVTNGLVMLLDARDPTSYPGSGATWTDLTGNNLNGSLVNTPAFTVNGGGSIRLDGTNEYILVGDNTLLDFGAQSFTVEYWFRKLEDTTPGTFNSIWGVNKWNSGASAGTNEWTLAIGNGTSGAPGGNNYSFSIEVGSTTYGTGFAPTTLLKDQWYQLIGQRNGARLNLYLNGVLTQTATPIGLTDSSVVNNVGRALRIGVSAALTNYSNTDNAILRIYNRALSDQEIAQNYNAHKARFGLL